MKPVVLIPSYNRPNSRIFEKLKSIGLEVYVFVRKEQYTLYRESLPPEMNLIKLSNVNDIGQTRNAMVRWAKSKRIEWAFMLDDDIQKVERLSKKPDGSGWNSTRILQGSKTPPVIDEDALKLWYKLAKKYKISLSSPNHRAYDRTSHGRNIRINKSAIIQCCLINISDAVSVGNYKSIDITGNEDYYLQYKLMSNGYNCGKIGLIEYDCKNMECSKKQQRLRVNSFLQNVCNNPDLISTKTTSTGLPSIKFVWKNWGGKVLNLDKRKE